MITTPVDWLKRIFGLGHSKSRTSRRIEEISKGDPELRAWLKPTLDLVEIRNCKGGIEKADRAKKREIQGLNDSLEGKTFQIEELERCLDRVERERRELIGAVSDYSQLPGGCLKHELALDTIITQLPQLSSSLAVDENRGMRIRPLTTSNHPAKLELFELEDPDCSIHTFTAPKSERIELRHSEDRVGFMENDRVYRLVAADGVGGSSHGGHLAQKLCESVLLNTGGARDAIRDELEGFSREMSGLKNGRSVTDKAEYWAQKANERGSACVLAVADVDIESGSVSGWQVGDTVVFVEVSDKRKGVAWTTFPDIDADSFGPRPVQLNCNEPKGSSALKQFNFQNATGRVIICTDGMAEHLLRNGIEEVAFGILEVEDPAQALDRLRRDGVADDDLSMIMICPK